MSALEQFGKGVKSLPSYKLCVISGLWTGRCIVVELLNQSPLPLSSSGFSACCFCPSFLLPFPTLPNVLIYPPGSSSSVCSLLAMETPRMAILARPALGSYNYLLTSSYNYAESFLLKRKTTFPALSIYSLLPGRTKLA